VLSIVFRGAEFRRPIEQLPGERDRNVNVSVLRFAEERSTLRFDADDSSTELREP
jgi:hypothetical protein